MDKRYKYIEFSCFKKLAKTFIWGCYNIDSRELLGEVKWNGPWRQYCFFTIDGMIFNNSCLANIQDFIRLAEEDRLNRKSLVTTQEAGTLKGEN